MFRSLKVLFSSCIFYIFNFEESNILFSGIEFQIRTEKHKRTLHFRFDDLIHYNNHLFYTIIFIIYMFHYIIFCSYNTSLKKLSALKESSSTLNLFIKLAMTCTRITCCSTIFCLWARICYIAMFACTTI